MAPEESMFKFHGYSGPCPKPPLPKKDLATRYQQLLTDALLVLDEFASYTAQQAIRSNIRNAAGEYDATGLVSPECFAAARRIIDLGGK